MISSRAKITCVGLILLLSFLLLVAACLPPTSEPGLEEGGPSESRSSTNQPFAEGETAVTPTQFPRPTTFPARVNPTSLDAVPASLPLYIMAREPIPYEPQAALVWAEAFGFGDAVLQETSPEMIRLFSSDAANGAYHELTFLRATYSQAIIYSSGPAVAAAPGPTPEPSPALNKPLPAEVVINAALAFVRQHNLLPEPIIAHELPFQNDHYFVHLAFAPAGFRLAGIGDEPGVTAHLDANGRVREARIIPASFIPGESVAVQPLADIYSAFVRGELPPALFFERAQFGQNGPQDFLRYQSGSLPFGDQDDRIELVYAALPTQPEYLLPMWLVTRPQETAWDHFVEYFLPATTGSSVPRPIPTPTPLAQTGIVPQSLTIIPPLLVDEEDGLLFTNAVVDGITHTVSLAAASGDLVAVYGLTGSLALDAGRNQLYVDKHPHGLTVIDSSTGEVLNGIQLPPRERGAAQPQADPATGNVLLFRDQMLLVADPLSPTWQQTVPFAVEGTVCDEPMTEPPAIDQTWFDPDARLLYLTLVDYICTPWLSFTVIVFDLNTMTEIARYPRVSFLSGAAVDGRFYAKSWFRLGKAFQWGWHEGQPWLPELDRGDDFIGGFSGFQVDRARGYLYEMTVNGLQVLSMESMAVVQTVPPPVAGQIAGYDPFSDQLYFVGQDGRLLPWPVDSLLAPE